MTLAPANLPASAVELRDDDGNAAATIYGRPHGIEIVCAEGFTIEHVMDIGNDGRIGLVITRAEEARRR